MLHSELGILKVSAICIKNSLQQQRKLPDIFISYYKLNNNVHCYNTEMQQTYMKVEQKQHWENSIKTKVVNLFNYLFEKITKLDSTNKFKRVITKTLPSAYENL